MVRLGSLIAGVFAFTAAHLVETARWRTWFSSGGAYAPWFLNAGRAVLFTCVCVALAAAMASGVARGREAAVRAANVAAGSVAAMAITQAVVGPGTIFPIVFIVGVAVITVAALVGAGTSAAVRGRRVR